MNGQIGMLKKPSGQIGNQLFQIHFLRQVTKRLGTTSFYPKSDAILLVVEGKSVNRFSILGRPTFRLYGLQDIESAGLEFWIESCEESLRFNQKILLKPGILGSLFFESCYENPSEILHLSKEVLSPPEYRQSKDAKVAAIHFRGLDFVDWDRNAILGSRYYLDSIEFLLSEGVELENIYFTTDDPNHLVSQAITKRLGQSISKNVSVAGDFAKLAFSDFLISSPSTFAFWAGVLGKKKKIIHNKTWLDYNVDRNIKFWVDIRKSNSEIYSVYKEI